MADKGLEDIEAGESSLLLCCGLAVRMRCAAGPRPGAATKFANNTCTDMLRAVAQIESNYDETTDSFDAMDLKPELLRGIYAYGFERPSAIQQRAIMPVIKGMCSPQKLTTKRAETNKQ